MATQFPYLGDAHRRRVAEVKSPPKWVVQVLFGMVPEKWLSLTFKYHTSGQPKKRKIRCGKDRAKPPKQRNPSPVKGQLFIQCYQGYQLGRMIPGLTATAFAKVICSGKDSAPQSARVSSPRVERCNRVGIQEVGIYVRRAEPMQHLGV